MHIIGEILTSNMKATKVSQNEYRLGLWVRDSASGVGTMSFYEPNSKRFAALGHGISDSDTGDLLNIESGAIITSKLVNITKGRKTHKNVIELKSIYTSSILSFIKNSKLISTISNITISASSI